MKISEIIWITPQERFDDNFYKEQSTCSRKIYLGESHDSSDAFI